jgi:peptide/nickel transport system ATP-binding protein
MSQIQLGREQAGSSGELQPDGTALLEVEDLVVLFPSQQGFLGRVKKTITAVDHVSFSIKSSEVLSLVGESGSGKTTIARCICALTRPTSGSIKFNGTDVSKLKGKSIREYRKKVQMIYQDPYGSLYSRQDVFTIISNPIKLLTGERSKTAIQRKVIKILAEVGLDPSRVMNKLPHQLSGGERQRVNIARALAPDPQLLIADEPVTMLDASQRLNILSLLMRLKQTRNLTIVLITHDLASAWIMGGRTGIIYLGKLVESGPTYEVLSRPMHPYTELILSATPRLDAEPQLMVYEPGTTIEDSLVSKAACIFAPRCKYATEICMSEEPQFLERASGHRVACHHYLNQTD